MLKGYFEEFQRVRIDSNLTESEVLHKVKAK